MKKRFRLLFLLISCWLILASPALAATSETTLYFGDHEKILDQSGEVLEEKTYLALPHVMVLKKDGEVFYLHQDHLASTRLITDNQGNKVAEYDYFPYGTGEPSSVTPEVSDRLYTSQNLDPSTSLYYYYARYYNPTTAHFISADSAEGPNRYTYVAGNPISRNDPTGNAYDMGGGGKVEDYPHYKQPLPNQYGILYSPTIKIFNILVGWVPVSGQLTLLMTDFAGEVTARGAQDPEFIKFQRKVYSETNFNAKSDLEFIESLTMSMNRNTQYNSNFLAVYEGAWTQEEEPSNLALALSDLSVVYTKGNALRRTARGQGVCAQFALTEHYLLGQQGIQSEIVESRSLQHALIRTTIGGVPYIVDPTWGLVMPQSEHGSAYGVSDYNVVGNLYDFHLDDWIAEKSWWQMFLDLMAKSTSLGTVN